MKKRLLSALLVLAIVLTVMPAGALADEEDGRTYLKVEKVEDGTAAGERLTDGEEGFTPLPEAQQTLDPEEEVRVSIVLEKPSTIKAGYSTVNIASNASAMSYREGLRHDQETVQMKIERQVLGGDALDVVWNMTLAANIISANVKRGEMEDIANVDGVKKVIEEVRYEPQVISVGGELEPNMAISGTMNGAQSVWNSGMYGAGSKIAVIDTGLDTDHQSFDEGAFKKALEGQEDVDLLTKDDISELIDELNINDRDGLSNFDADGVYLSSKVPFAYNYVDGDNDVTHDNDEEGEHGSHVAGIAAANRYIPVKDGDKTTYEDALKTVKMAGNAPDAQLLIMKVFGKNGGAYDSDYMVAIEDAIILGADAINLSLGSSAAGFATDTTYQSIFDDLTKSESVVTVSAGNSGSWGDYTAYGAYGIYNDGVNFDTVGSPGSYDNSFTVASVENTGFISNAFSVDGEYFGFFESLGGTNASLATLDEDPEYKGTVKEFVMLESTTAGHEAEALKALEALENVDLKGKIIIVHRGTTSFSVKATACVEAGAAAVFIANNDTGIINMDLSDYEGTAPVVSITKDSGEALYGAGTPTEFEFKYTVQTEDGEDTGEEVTVKAHYITGKMTVYGSPVTFDEDSSVYTMSDFSSWGVPGDLSLKPEITAPGGNIWSVNGAIKDGKSYELMSGTSMAAPQIAGLTALVKEYLRSKSINEELSSRALTQSLLMSTAKPMKDNSGNYYPVFQQGAGLANVNSAVTTPAYITVEGQDDGKVKAELGDDPTKVGIYTVDFTVHNLTDNDLFYAFDADAFTQSYWERNEGYKFLQYSTRDLGIDVVFTVDGVELAKNDEELLKYDFDGDKNVDKKDAQLLLDSIVGKDVKIEHNVNNKDVNGDGEINTYDVHLLIAMGQAYAPVPAHGSVDVSATITLTKEEVAKLAEENPAGAYIEAYITATAKSTPEGVAYPDLSIPVLGYYGSWTDASMYDAGGYGAGAQKMPYLYYSTGGNTNFISTNSDTIRTVDGDAIGEGVDVSKYYYTLIRNAGNGIVQIRDADTDELYWQSAEFGRSFAAYVRQSATSASWSNIQNTAKINWDQTDMNGDKVPSGTRVTVSLIMAPEYYADSEGKYDWEKLTNGVDTPDDKELHAGAFLSTTIYVDTVAPEIVTEGDDATYASYVKEDDGQEHLHVFASVKDDVSVVEIDLINEADNSLVHAFSPSVLNTDYDPIFEPTKPGEVYKAEFDGTHNLYYNSYFGYVDYGKTEDLEKGVYLIAVYDVAGNEAVYRIFADINATKDVEKVNIYDESGEPIEEPVTLVKGEQIQFTGTADPYTLSDRSVTWSSSNEAVLTVDDNGVVTAVGKGTAEVIAAAKLDKSVTASVTVEVFAVEVELDAIIYDADSNIWWSKFNTGDLPEFSHLTNEPVDGNEGPYFMAAAYGSDGELYASTQEDHGGGLVSDLYKIDTKTFEYQKVGGSDSYGYVDLAETHSLGENTLIGVYGPDIVLIDTKSGSPIGAFGYLDDGSYLVGIAYVETQHNTVYNQDIDLYLMIASDGSVYEEAFMQYGTQYVYFLGSEEGSLGRVAALDIGDMFYNNSAYISDDYLFWSRYEEGGNSASLYALDIISADGTGNVYNLGSFGEDVWPVTGLFQLKTGEESGNGTNSLPIDLTDASVYENVVFTTGEADTLPIADDVDDTAEGGLNSIDTGEKTAETKKSSITVDIYSGTVTVPVYADSTNGDVTLTYDSSKLTLRSVDAKGTALTSHVNTTEGSNGSLRLGFAQKGAVNGVVATLVFGYTTSGSTTLTLAVSEDGETTYKDPVSTKYPVELQIYIPPTPVFPSTPSTPSTPTTPEKPEEVVHFNDVPEGRWYADAVYKLAEMGIINGVGDNKFAPNSNADRAAVAVMLYRIAGEPEVEGAVSFDDVPAGSWYAKAVKWALDTGAITGTSETTFMPKRMITRQELVTILWRYAKDNGYSVVANGFIMPNFADIDQVAGYAKEAMSWAVRVGVIRGTDGNRLMPKGYATRAEIAVVLARFLALDKTYVEE